jgi:hypothetical protein
MEQVCERDYEYMMAKRRMCTICILKERIDVTEIKVVIKAVVKTKSFVESLRFSMLRQLKIENCSEGIT